MAEFENESSKTVRLSGPRQKSFSESGCNIQKPLVVIAAVSAMPSSPPQQSGDAISLLRGWNSMFPASRALLERSLAQVVLCFARFLLWPVPRQLVLALFPASVVKFNGSLSRIQQG